MTEAGCLALSSFDPDVVAEPGRCKAGLLTTPFHSHMEGEAR